MVLREMVDRSDGVAFICNSAILPLAKEDIVLSNLTWESLVNCTQHIEKRLKNAEDESTYIRFQSPSNLETEFVLPHSGAVRGMLIPEGVVVIAGGGYHGKSTLLNALKVGKMDHIPGHYCEFVVCRTNTVSVRAEEGRMVQGIDITPFISELPVFAKVDPALFVTNHASGSTSMAGIIFFFFLFFCITVIYLQIYDIQFKLIATTICNLVL